MQIFDSVARTDRGPRLLNEPTFAFLNRAGADFFAPVRDLLQMWLDRVPAEHQAGLVGNLQSGLDAQFDSAFWELYLHQVLTGSGARVTIHPDVATTSKHPDFLVEGDVPYFLEAVSVGISPELVSQQRRLAEVEAVLQRTQSTGWTLRCAVHASGPRPPKAKRLRQQLLRWLDGLPDSTAERARASLASGDYSAALPSYPFSEDGWHLVFTALPTGPGRDVPLVSIHGAARAGGVDNGSRMREKLNEKMRRYGRDLPHPLVIAVLSNTEPRTLPRHVQPVLFGLHARGPSQVTDHGELATEGHWRIEDGWRRTHNPYVIVGSTINPYTIGTRAPWSWRTLDPRVETRLALPWASPVDTTVAEPPEPDPVLNLAALGISPDWCRGEPDFS